jgi:hypothetical protein
VTDGLRCIFIHRNSAMPFFEKYFRLVVLISAKNFLVCNASLSVK